MEEVMEITLHDQEGKELGYRVQQLFTVEGSEQMYCCAVAENGENAVFAVPIVNLFASRRKAVCIGGTRIGDEGCKR